MGKEREVWLAAPHRVTKSWHDCTLNNTEPNVINGTKKKAYWKKKTMAL